MKDFEQLTDINKVIALLPQKPPMVMIDKLLFSDDTVTRTALTVSDNNIFFEDGVLREPGIIENIAQTAAIRAGYHYKSKNQTPPIGFIGAIKNLVIDSLPMEGDVIITEIRVETEIMNATVISAEVKVGAKIIAGGEMKIFIIGDPAQNS